VRRLRLFFRPEALDDLSEIFRFVLRLSRSPATAAGFVRRIRARCDRIADAPLGGRPRDDLQPGLRTVPFERSAVIAYVVREDRVVITNVFYGGRDYEALYPVRDEGSSDE
jgi:toxin ParE1/3/4